MKALNLTTGMTFHDNSLITILSETAHFVKVSLSNGDGMEGKSVNVKWKKTSNIKLAGE